MSASIERISSGATELPQSIGSALNDWSSLRTGFKFAMASGAVALAAPASSATFDEIRTTEESRPPAKNFEMLGNYARLEARMMTAYSNTAQALAGLNSRIDQLASVVSLLAHQQTDATAALGEDLGSLDAESLLNRACDAGMVDQAVVTLAETELSNDDVFTRIAAIRTIALADPARGRALIEQTLQTERSPSIQNALAGTLRAIV
ncbi:hypothetical protein [Sphingobium agri]|uniref:DUF4142 domain-containing protein n=1 Tax=Sphingobium agri TaxID=2933566 RepID=A0ABT0E240_9SPHN|nr:hypothetical protein [Sphingobium agri]MCK0533432.1 hypothetical protein [Sphingobium agri]